VAYYAMLSFVSSPGSIAKMKENWFPAQTCLSLVAAKRHASQRESPLPLFRNDEGAGDLNYFGRRRYRRFVSKRGLSMQWR
jgi:hypothetical protein